VHCIRQCIASDSVLHQEVHGIRSHQTVRRNRQYIASGSVLYQCGAIRHVRTKGEWRAAYRVRVEHCVASDSVLHQEVHGIRSHQRVRRNRQYIATDSTSHQAAYCISAEQYVTSGPRVNGEQRIASELSSALHQTV